MRPAWSAWRTASGSAAAAASVASEKMCGHFVLAHRDLDLHAGIVDLAEHLGDTAERLRMQRWRLGQFDRHHLPDACVGDGVARHDDVLAIALVFRGHQPDAALVQQAADDRRLLALDDFEHVAFGPALLIVANDACLDTVAVQYRAHFLRRQVQIGSVLADDESVAVAMALNGALHFGHQLVADAVGGLGRCLVCDVFDDKVRGCLRCPGGGIGRRTSFRLLAGNSVGVRVPSWAPRSSPLWRAFLFVRFGADRRLIR